MLRESASRLPPLGNQSLIGWLKHQRAFDIFDSFLHPEPEVCHQYCEYLRPLGSPEIYGGKVELTANEIIPTTSMENFLNPELAWIVST
jgi:hypothetical protein